jgi:hypothetical protein
LVVAEVRVCCGCGEIMNNSGGVEVSVGRRWRPLSGRFSITAYLFNFNQIEIYEQEGVVVRVLDTTKIVSPTVIAT